MNVDSLHISVLSAAILPLLVALANLLVLPRVPEFNLGRTTARCIAFGLFTMSLFHSRMVPTARPDLVANSDYRLVWGALQISWWLLAACTVSAVTRTFFNVGGTLKKHQFSLDIVETILYLGAGVGIISDVLDIPLKGVLATSGALAIVLGLALQSTLSDLFSGLVINASAPYRLGDYIWLDQDTEGTVVEITWRATYLKKSNKDLVVIPNSLIAKARIVNSSTVPGPHAITVSFQALSQVRPSNVTKALRLAVDTCIDINPEPVAKIVTNKVGWEAVDYEIQFYMKQHANEEDVRNAFYDAAHRHLESFSILSPSHELNVKAGDPDETSLQRRLIDGVTVFGLLNNADRAVLAATMTHREILPGTTIMKMGEVSNTIQIISHGIVSVTIIREDVSHDIMRLGPWDFFGESGTLAGIATSADFKAKTYVIVYELPQSSVSKLLKDHPEVSHALASRLADRLHDGDSLIHAAIEMPKTRHGLAEWVGKCIRSVHGLVHKG